MLLVLACIGLLAVANGLRPFRGQLLVVPSFFAAWLTVELAPQLLALTLVVTVLLAVFVGVSWLGLVVTALVVAGLAAMVVQSERAAQQADAALADWPEPVDPADRVTGPRKWFRKLSYKHPDVERIADVPYGDLGRHRLDVYRHRSGATGAPTLLQVHGGAWVIGDKKQQGRPLMNHLAARGWVCFAPNYRLSPRATWPDHLVDVKRAIAWVREHGAEYGADPGFLVITGGSAGGHLSSLAALTQNEPVWQPGFEDADTSVSACVPYYGVYDLNGETGTTAATVREKRLLARMVMKTRERSVYEQASPLTHVSADAPPFFVIHGRNDTLVPVEEARLLVERLRAVSPNPVLYLELPGTEHAFDVFPSIRSDHVVGAVGRFCELVRVRSGHVSG